MLEASTRTRQRDRRSQSPGESRRTKQHDRRSRSPDESRRTRAHDGDYDRSSHSRRHQTRDSNARSLPYGQSQLSKYDLQQYGALFAEYLQLQKRLVLSELSDSEVKGRWKSFIGKWNRGELSDGWYDSAMFRRAVDRSRRQASPCVRSTATEQHSLAPIDRAEESEDDGIGPSLPANLSLSHGPAIPNLQDLQYQHEIQQQDRLERKEELKYERKLERRTDKERLEDLVPLADPGSRERQLEKRREVASSNRAFADARDSGTVEIPDNDLVGEDGIDAYKAKMHAQQRQKNEREIKREEILRARAAEREERLAEHRHKEAKTMETLRALAQQRYGS